jgi:hypothetical protein
VIVAIDRPGGAPACGGTVISVDRRAIDHAHRLVRHLYSPA